MIHLCPTLFFINVETPQDTKKQWMLTIPSNKSLQLTFDTVFELSTMSYIQVMRYNTTFLNITGELDMILVCVKFITILFSCVIILRKTNNYQKII